MEDQEHSVVDIPTAGTTSPISERKICPSLDEDFHRAIAITRRNGKIIAAVYNEAFSKGAVSCAEFLDEAQRFAEFKTSKKRLAGLVGPSGAGKSLLINALLGQKGLALVQASGKAVTCFPAHYRKRSPQHQAKFTLTVVFPSREKIEDLMELGMVLRSFLDDLNAPFSIPKDDIAAEEKESMKQVSAAAGAALTALFGQFTDFDLDRLKYAEWGEDQVTAEEALSSWAYNLPFPEDMSTEGIWTVTGETTAEIQKAMKKIRDNGLWPLIRSMTVYLDAPLLQNGLTLVDLPGYQDSNLARVRIARDTQARCDDLFIVGNITRAHDNPILHDIVEENAARHKTDRLAMQTITAVCTHSAEVPDDDELDDVLDEDVAKEALANATKRIDMLEAEDVAQRVINDANHERDRIVILARNKKITAEMQMEYGPRLGRGRFHISCVDSKKFLSKDEKWEAISGIPGLRNFIANLPGEIVFRLSEQYLSSEQRTVVAAFESWLRRWRKRPKSLKNVLPQPTRLRECLAKVDDLRPDLIALFEKKILNILTNPDERVSEIAYEVAVSWRAIHHASLGALCRRDGIHFTMNDDRRVRIDLNQQLINDCFAEISITSWEGFENSVEAKLTKLDAETVREFQEYLAECAKLEAPKDFLESLRPRQDSLSNLFEEARKKLSHQHGKICRRVIESNAQGYVNHAMCTTYGKAAEQQGNGASDKRREILEFRAISLSFITMIATQMASDYKIAIKKPLRKLSEKIEDAISKIQQEVDILQGRQDEIELFKLHPELGERAEKALVEIKKNMEEVDRLAERARTQASKLYGEESRLELPKRSLKTVKNGEKLCGIIGAARESLVQNPHQSVSRGSGLNLLFWSAQIRTKKMVPSTTRRVTATTPIYWIFDF